MNIEIPDFLREYINNLVNIFQEIKEIWILGSRANSNANENSDWDIMIFASSKVLDDLRKNVTFKHKDIDLLVVYDGNRFEEPWVSLSRGGKEIIKKGELKEWSFRKTEDNVADYLGSKPNGYFINSTPFKMYRIWNRGSNWIEK